jgi:hypothetical protein
MATGTMVCLYCRKKIGLLRSLQDRSFCCADHRKKLASKSARAVREAEDLFGFDDSQVSWRVLTQVKPEEKAERRTGFGASIFFAVSVVVILLALSQLPSSAPAGRAVSPEPNASLHQTQGGFGRLIGRLIETKGSGTLREDFRSGFGNWEGLRSIASDWKMGGGEVRPTSLRLWKPSTSLSNYELEFMGQIDRKSLDWAFRAADLRNYYATKLIIARPGSLPNAGLIRYVVLNGRERERVELPLPLTIERGVDYRVRVSVRGNHFLTSINGQLVSSWTDNLLSRGGVGFFSENGESALLKWVTLSERDSMLARIASHFSLITFPTAATASADLPLVTP